MGLSDRDKLCLPHLAGEMRHDDQRLDWSLPGASERNRSQVSWRLQYEKGPYTLPDLSVLL